LTKKKGKHIFAFPDLEYPETFPVSFQTLVDDNPQGVELGALEFMLGSGRGMNPVENQPVGFRRWFYFLLAFPGGGVAASWLTFLFMGKPDILTILVGIALFHIPLLVFALAMPVVVYMGWRHLKWWERMLGCAAELLALAYFVYVPIMRPNDRKASPSSYPEMLFFLPSSPGTEIRGRTTAGARAYRVLVAGPNKTTRGALRASSPGTILKDRTDPGSGIPKSPSRAFGSRQNTLPAS
jgi:hypothetical protein